MKSGKWLFAALISAAGLALAQTPTSTGVTESTDQAKIAEIEKHAQELEKRTTTPAAGERDHTKKQGAQHHKSKAKPKQEMKDKPPPQTGTDSDTESKN
jgi:hypothetical protein